MNKINIIKKTWFKAIKPLLIYTVLIFALIVSAGIGQFGQYMKSSKDAREYLISDWTGDDSARQNIVNLYKDCGASQNEKRVKQDFRELVDKQPVTIYQCAEFTGSSEFLLVLKNAVKINKSVAWPLSLLNFQDKT